MLWLCLAGLAQAQVNVETIAAGIEDAGWDATVGFGFGVRAGNVNWMDLNANASIAFLRPIDPEDPVWFRDRVIIHGNWHYKTLNGASFTNNKFAHLRYTHMFQKRLGVDAYLQAGNDAVLLLDQRYLAGVGLRFVAWHGPRFSLWGGTGHMTEFEQRAEDIDPRTMVNQRWNTFATVRWTLVPDTVDLVSTTYVQPRWDDLSDVQVLEELSLSVSLNDTVSLGSGLVLRHDSQAPGELAATDLSTTHTLRFHW